MLESNIFAPGGTAVFVVTEDGEGSILEEVYDRQRVGWKAKIMERTFPKMAPKMFDQSRAATYKALGSRMQEKVAGSV